MKQKKFLIIAGDKRQGYLKEMLSNMGHNVTYLRECRQGEFDAILLPVSESSFYYDKLCKTKVFAKYVFGCNVKSKMVTSCDERSDLASPKTNIIEYMGSDSVAYKNAVATSEGAIAQAIIMSDINLHKSNVLLAGFGRCGEIIADRLAGFKCSVTVMETDEIRKTKAYVYGYNVTNEEELCEDGKKYQFLFNTVPYVIFNSKVLKKFSNNITIIDIASKSGGVDFEFCRVNHIKACHALGIPGKYAPETSAQVLLSVIKKSMNI